MTPKEKKLTLSFKVTKGLYQKLNEKVVADGYGMRGKTRWIEEAIEMLFKLPEYSEYVELTDAMDEKLDSSITIRLPRQLVQVIEKKATEVRKIYLNLEGIKSKIVRAAILQRMIRV